MALLDGVDAGAVGGAHHGLAISDRAGALAALPHRSRPSAQEADRLGSAIHPLCLPVVARPADHRSRRQRLCRA